MEANIAVANGNIFDSIRENGTIYSEEKMKSCFQAFDKDHDGGLDINEFGVLTRFLFCNEKGKPYAISAQRTGEMFAVFDKNQDGVIDLQEFRDCWNNWIRQHYVAPGPELHVIGSLGLPKNQGENCRLRGLCDPSVYVHINWVSAKWKGCCILMEELQFMDDMDLSRDRPLILFPLSALLVIDVQNDFISGSLALHKCPAKQDGTDVVPVINQLINTVQYDAVVYSFDWHPQNHVSFIENVKNRKIHASSKVNADNAKLYDTVIFEGPPLIYQKLWPAHCVQDSWGSKLHRDLKVVDDPIFVHKGTNPDIDSYSAFWDNSKLSHTSLQSELQQRNITDVYVCGLAYDVCVGATARDALEHGYRTVLIDDACRGVNTDDIQKIKSSLIKNHAVIMHSSQVKAMVLARDRRPEMGYRAALTLSAKISNEDRI